ncbi:uncharacterized protein LAESUDRAFT_717304 [Laetiporus sulphureus 93-53]|uniref:Myosin tail domain-containing protein n=1 Tax=Laetiporus sulphureus 93-53 TaxID=1314785 RepID=A0A165BV43_9APHY|nr:uncharacterized protein LAESUDRAFT_717304 [Laetiporus sulphureus 93-53]KZT01711.1 hypothetical protein LAESUDRAFT_717304 [Laetiporus sulphureus 93-53]
MWTARRQMKKILNRAVVIRTIQRNAYVRPLLVATRNDEALRQKEAELVLIKERAEWEQKEKEALEGLRMRLEAEKSKVETELEAERALALDKDALLERSKKREAELEDEVAALQADLDILDSQLDRALKLQKESEEKHETLRQAFDQAAEHLVRLEAEQQEREGREADLNQQLDIAQEETDVLKAEREELQKIAEELKDLAAQREQDLARATERMDSLASDLNNELSAESRNRFFTSHPSSHPRLTTSFSDVFRDKVDTLEQEARQAKEQLAEMARTATEYSNMIKQKEQVIDRLTAELEKSKGERGQLLKQITELQARVDTLSVELDAQHSDRERDSALQSKLQQELDELCALLARKSTEETRRSEVEKSKGQELTDLRGQVSQLSRELDDARRVAVEGNNTLKAETDTLDREYRSLQQSYNSLLEREQSAQAQLMQTATALAEAEKTKRALDSELQLVRSRLIDTESQLAEMQKSKEALERQLTATQAKYEDSEDVVLQLEREKSAHDRQVEAIKKQLGAESAKRSKLERTASSQKIEIARLKEMNTKFDRELNKALSELKARAWEVKQPEAKQDKTIVEHVHVLEEAKRVTDHQLLKAQEEFEANRAYLKSLEKAKSRLMNEAEDLTRKREEAAEAHVKRLQIELQHTQEQVTDVKTQLATVQKAKDNLDLELTRLADQTDAPMSAVRLQRQHEARISMLESQLEEAEMAKDTAARIKEHVDRKMLENARLSELLEDEAEARRAAEAARLNGVQAMWDKFKTTIQDERQNDARLEESRKALVIQQRTANVELEDQHRQVQELLLAKKQMQSEIADLKDRLELEIVAKNEVTNAKRQLQQCLQKLEIKSSASTRLSSEHSSELHEAMDSYKAKIESYMKQLEESEVAKVKVTRAEQAAPAFTPSILPFSFSRRQPLPHQSRPSLLFGASLYPINPALPFCFGASLPINASLFNFAAPAFIPSYPFSRHHLSPSVPPSSPLPGDNAKTV